MLTIANHASHLSFKKLVRCFEHTDNRDYENNMQISTFCPISFRTSFFLLLFEKIKDYRYN